MPVAQFNLFEKLDTPIMRAGDERNRYLENVDVELIGCAKSGHSETPCGAYARVGDGDNATAKNG
jgi:hypothetical protein